MLRDRNPSQSAKIRARELRKKMSLPEVLLWKAIKNGATGFKVRRQHPIGIYTLDFFLPEALLCVEVDGATHDFREEKDFARDQALDALGIHTVRCPAAAVSEKCDPGCAHDSRDSVRESWARAV